MAEEPDDRPKQDPAAADGDPRIFVVVDGTTFPVPGLETFFSRPGEAAPQVDGCSCHPVAAVVCSCNKVCRCVPVCACAGHVSCGCDNHRSGGGGRVAGCRCAPVH